MTAMADPHDGLLKYQEALTKRWITPQICKIHTELTLLVDDADGSPRLTYALVDHDGDVRAIVVYLPVDPYKGHHCFQVGYAVAETRRKQGLAVGVLKMSIDEMRMGFKPHMQKFYVEAVIGKYNAASIKVAEKVFGEPHSEILDNASGESSLRYFMMIE